MHRDLHVRSQRDFIAVAHDHVGFHFAGDRGLAGGRQFRFRARVVDIAAARGQILVHMRAAGTKERYVRLVNHDFCFAAREFPQRMRAADMVDVSVRQQNPAHVFDAPAQLRERRRDAIGGRCGDAGIDNRRLAAVDKKAVEAKASPLREQRVDIDGFHR